MGKTWLAKQALQKVATYSDAEILIYTPVDFDGWPSRAKIYSNPDEFVKAIEKYIVSGKRACHVYIDEMGKINTHYGHYKRYPKVLQELTFMLRHMGITVWISSQRATMVHPDIRENLGEIYCFYLKRPSDRQAVEDESCIKEYNGKPLNVAIGELQKLEFFVINPKKRTLEKKRLG